MKRTIAIILGVAIAVSACSGGNSPPRSNHTDSTSLSRSGPSTAILGRGGLISVLPDTCPADRTSLPKELSGAHLFDSFEAPIPNAQSCEWSVTSNSHARILTYTFRNFESLTQARKEFSFRKGSTGSGDDDCHHTKASVKKISNLGEEAFAAPCRVKKEQLTEAAPADQIYEVGGLELDFRIRNTIAWFFWVGADYSPTVAKQNPHWLHGGNELSYEQALPQALNVARSTLRHFPQ